MIKLDPKTAAELKAEFNSMFGVNPPAEATQALLHAHMWHDIGALRDHLREIADRTKH